MDTGDIIIWKFTSSRWPFTIIALVLSRNPATTGSPEPAIDNSGLQIRSVTATEVTFSTASPNVSQSIWKKNKIQINFFDAFLKFEPLDAGFLKFPEISARNLIWPFLIIGYCVYSCQNNWVNLNGFVLPVLSCRNSVLIRSQILKLRHQTCTIL